MVLESTYQAHQIRAMSQHQLKHSPWLWCRHGQGCPCRTPYLNTPTTYSLQPSLLILWMGLLCSQWGNCLLPFLWSHRCVLRTSTSTEMSIKPFCLGSLHFQHATHSPMYSCWCTSFAPCEYYFRGWHWPTSVFDSQIKVLEGEELRITLTENAKPFLVLIPHAPFSLHIDKLKADLDLLQSQGVVAPVTITTEWCILIVVRPKKGSDRIRFCIDLSHLNHFVKRERCTTSTVSLLILLQKMLRCLQNLTH